MYSVKHYWVRLRWSQRRPYLVARWLIGTAALLVLVAILLAFAAR
jgi:hypothetical protein